VACNSLEHVVIRRSVDNTQVDGPSLRKPTSSMIDECLIADSATTPDV
jgi:hypothetical protein